MNISTKLIFFLEDELEQVCGQVLDGGSEVLSKSAKLDKFQVSLREVFGLCVLTRYRDFLDPGKNWAFSTESQISDDGSVVSLVGNKTSYIECVEQVYLPGKYLMRSENNNINEHILSNLVRVKGKGLEYYKDTSLFILSDVSSIDETDCFEWKDFAKGFFTELPFLHVYFLTLIKHSQDCNEYYLFSFTNQKHRQNLNGEFSFKMTQDGISNFTIIQKINLLESKT